MINGDLNSVIIPKITLDKYQPVLDSSNIVITLELRFEDAATDLIEYLDNGNYGILDLELSKSFNNDGNWLIFVEYESNAKIAASIMKLTQDLEKCADEKLEWVVVYNKKNYRLDEDFLTRQILLIKLKNFTNG